MSRLTTGLVGTFGRNDVLVTNCEMALDENLVGASGPLSVIDENSAAVGGSLHKHVFVILHTTR